MGIASKHTDPRHSRIAKIHIARKQLAMEDAAYREILRRITGQSTSTACDMTQLDAMLVEMKRLGFADRAPWRPPAGKPYVRLIYVLWGDLKPFLRNHSRSALRHFVQRQTKCDARPDGVEAPEFLNPDEANLVIEGLKSWLARERRNKEHAT